MMTVICIPMHLALTPFLAISSCGFCSLRRRMNTTSYSYPLRAFEKPSSRVNQNRIQYRSPALLHDRPLPVRRRDGSSFPYYVTAEQTANPISTEKQKYKTRLCVNFQNGYCKYGSMCRFAHGEKELRTSYHQQ